MAKKVLIDPKAARNFYAGRANEAKVQKDELQFTHFPSRSSKKSAPLTEKPPELSVESKFLSACENGDLEAVKEIIDDEIKDKNGETSPVLRKILNEWKTAFGKTGFMFAAFNGHKKLVQFLLTFKELDLEQRDVEGQDALAIANSGSDLDFNSKMHVATVIAEELLKRGISSQSK
ncbi:MAG: ankyrin repeat domain-containing protein [Candidatus Micrarchaeota archaeon]